MGVKCKCLGKLLFVPIVNKRYQEISSYQNLPGRVSDCRSRGLVFDPGPVPYFRGD